jgi:anti-sigma factor ChrR (cupin superfamily)
MVMNSDLSARVVLDTQSMDWLATAEMERRCKLLDGDDVAAASATRVVKCAPGSAFDSPTHGLGEEILVLQGMLADDHAEYSAGTYLRNPPGAPRVLRTGQGCVLFVKRYPFEPADSALVRIDTANTPWRPGLVPGLSVMPLHEHQPHAHFGGEEILVLAGVFEDEHGSYRAGTWIRSPHLSRHQPFSRPGCTIYVKTGHLLDH